MLFSAAALCSVADKNELLLFLFFVLCALRVADVLTASAIVCAHKASARLMYAAGVTLLLAALVYFVAYVGPAPAVLNANKLAVFGAFFATVFFYAAPGETGLF